MWLPHHDSDEYKGSFRQHKTNYNKAKQTWIEK